MSSILERINSITVKEMLENIRLKCDDLLHDFTNINISLGKPEGGYMDVSYHENVIYITTAHEKLTDYGVYIENGEYNIDNNNENIATDMLIPVFDLLRTVPSYEEQYKLVFWVAFMIAHELGHVLDIERNRASFNMRYRNQELSIIGVLAEMDEISDNISKYTCISKDSLLNKWYASLFDVESRYRNLPLEAVADSIAINEILVDISLSDLLR